MPKQLLVAYHRLARERKPERWRRTLLTLIHGGIALVRALVEDRIHVRAATLGYWSLVALVPLLLLAFALMGPLGLLESVADKVRDALYTSIFAGSISEVVAYLDELVKDVKLETLGVAGFLGVLFTGSRIYFSVEQAYNDIFNLRVRRGWLLRITLFYAVVTLGPLLLSMGFVATSSLGKTLPSGLVGRAVPVALTTTAFVLGIKLLPQTRIRWRAAVAGGLTSAILFEGAKASFSAYTTLLGSTSNVARIYGSLGLLPVFLVYLYLLWLIVLLGVELAYVVQYAAQLLPREEARLQQGNDRRRSPDALFAIHVLAAVSERFQGGSGPVSAEEVADSLETSARSVRTALDVLAHTGLLVEVEVEGFVPARPLSRTTAADAVLAYRKADTPGCGPTAPGAATVRRALDGLVRELDISLDALPHADTDPDSS